MAVQAMVFPNQAILLRPTIHVDLVDLPSQTKAPEQELDTSLPIKEDVKAPEEEKSETEPDAFKKEIDKPKEKSPEAIKEDAKAALKKLKEEVEKKKRLDREAKINSEKDKLKRLEEKARQAIRGNQVNQGTSLDGVMDKTFNAYLGHVSEKIKSNWALPTWLQSRNLRASVRIYIDEQGRISRFLFTQKSPDESFDNYVADAIKKSTFAPPPAEMARLLGNSGIEVAFPL